MKTLKNTYYVLRHGRNIHQTELKDFCYGWPDDKIPCKLDEVGIKQVTVSGMKLKDKQIDSIYSSDILRTKQTSEIVSSILNLDEINFDERLRDVNWGIFAEGPKDKAFAFYNDKNRMEDSPPQGESWGDLKKRILSALMEIEEKHADKNILIVSHGDPILILEAFVNDWNLDEILNKKRENMIQTGEFRKLN